MDDQYLGTGLVCQISGASPRQLDYWVMRGLLRPSGRPTPKARWRAYTIADAIVARVIMELREQGVSLQHVRAALLKLQDDLSGNPEAVQILRTRKLIAYGGRVFIEDAKSPPYRVMDGQTTFLFVDFAEVYKEVAPELEKVASG